MADRIDIRNPLLIKNADLFLITEQDGGVPKAPPGFGLFYRDCCCLSRYEFSLNGTGPLHLMTSWDHGFVADIELSNADLKTANETPIQAHMLGISASNSLSRTSARTPTRSPSETSAARMWNSRSP